MAWMILWANGEELTRLELSRAVVIGRSNECDLSVRDVLMSRVHFRVEPLGHGWRIVDLGSKNGTRVGWQRIESHVLRDGDWLRAGRTRITFHAGPFQPGLQKPDKPVSDRLVRPADPHEALSGTVTDFVLLDDEEDPDLIPEESWGFPSPKPRPFEPASYSEPTVESLLHDLAYSASDLPAASVVRPSLGGTATLDRPRSRVRPLPRVLKKPIYRDIPHVAGAEADLALQADPESLPATQTAIPARPRRRRFLAALGIFIATLVGTAIVVMSAWLLTLAP